MRSEHLLIGGCDATALAKCFGTPLYVLDESLVRLNIKTYQDALARHYPGRSDVAYAGKAFLTTAMCRLLAGERAGLDVASAGELHTALKAKFPPERIHLHGNCKTEEEMVMALKSGVGRIIVDSAQELEILNTLAARLKKTAHILLRLAPGIEVATHRFIKTGHVETKFGIPIKAAQAERAASRALSLGRVRLRGFHAHLGSQIFDLKPFGAMIEILFDFLKHFQRRTGRVFDELNLGGGLAIQYAQKRRPPSVDRLARVIGKTVLEQCCRKIYPLPRLIVEPGRSIVGPAGTTLYTVHYVKKLPSGKTFVLVDGGLSDNPRPALYGAKYRVALANKIHAKPTQLCTVAGKHCETDVLFENVRLPSPQRGDVLAAFDTGAYNYSMASNYNRYPRPAVIFARRAQARLAVHRESLKDMVRQDR